MKKAAFIKTAFLMCSVGILLAGCDMQTKPTDRKTEPPKTDTRLPQDPNVDNQ